MVSETHPLLSARERERDIHTLSFKDRGRGTHCDRERGGDGEEERESTLKSLKPTSNDHHYHFDNI